MIIYWRYRSFWWHSAIQHHLTYLQWCHLPLRWHVCKFFVWIGVKFSWNFTHWRWKPTYKANAMGYLSLHALLISHWQLAEHIGIWCRSEHPCFYPPIVIHITVNSRVVCILDVYCISQIDKINHHTVFLKSRPHRNVRNVHPQFDHRAEFHVCSHVVYYRRITRWIE